MITLKNNLGGTRGVAKYVLEVVLRGLHISARR